VNPKGDGAMPMPQDRAMRPTTNDIEAANAELLAMGFFPIRGGDQTNDEQATESDDAATKAAEEEAARIADEEKQLNDAGKAALRKEREARKAAKQEADAARAELETLRKAKAEADEAKRQADEAEAVKKGEFEKLATERAETLKAKEADLAAANAKIASLVTALKPEVEDAWKALPDEITELYVGEADDVLAKRQFMASHKKLIDALTGKQDEAKNKFRQAGGKTPVPNGQGKPELQSPLSAREIRG
jgi:DNA repair exonuclease SbcCD ATPase subunit